jgi:hypothetical protein
MGKLVLFMRNIIKCDITRMGSDKVGRVTLAFKNVLWRLVDV